MTEKQREGEPWSVRNPQKPSLWSPSWGGNTIVERSCKACWEKPCSLASQAVVRVGPGTPAAHCPRKVPAFRRAAMLLLTSTFPSKARSMSMLGPFQVRVWASGYRAQPLTQSVGAETRVRLMWPHFCRWSELSPHRCFRGIQPPLSPVCVLSTHLFQTFYQHLLPWTDPGRQPCWRQGPCYTSQKDLEIRTRQMDLDSDFQNGVCCRASFL